MFYFVIFDAIAFFGLIFFALNLIFLMFIYLWPIKRSQYLARKVPLLINFTWFLVSLVFCVLAFLALYQFETVFNKSHSLESSVILMAALSATFLVLNLIFTIYLFGFSNYFVIFAPKNLIAFASFKTKRYFVENEKVVSLKTKQPIPLKKWIKLK